MINPNELRIGNCVLNIHGEMSMIMDGKMIDKFEWWNPIPLTEEWLLTFGFEKMKFYKDRISYRIPYTIYDEKGADYFITESWFQKITALNTATILNYDVKFVHQIQNLFFALTGTELELKKETV